MNKIVGQLKKIVGLEAKSHSPSPYGKWLNGSLTFVEEGKIKMEYIIREEFTNPGNIAHGGVFAGMLDEVMGMAVYTLDMSSFFVAINLSVDFLRPGKLNEHVVVEAEVIRQGKTMTHVEGRIFNKEGKILSKATSNLSKVNLS